MFIAFMMPATRNRMPIRILPTRRPFFVMVMPPLLHWVFGLCRKLSCVDQYKSDAAGPRAAVDPGVVGSLLNQHVARREMHLAVVEDHVDLAFHDHSVVDAARPVHTGMLRITLTAKTHFAQDSVAGHLLSLGRELDHAEDAAEPRRRHAALALRPVGEPRDVDGRLLGDPEQRRDDAGGLPQLPVRSR